MRVMKALALALVTFCAAPAEAATYYVSTNGSDGNNGSTSAPWATWDKAMGAARPGDTIKLRPGIYRPAGSGYTVAGTRAAGVSGSVITLEAEDPSSPPVLDCGLWANGTSDVYCLRIRHGYWTVRNIKVTKARQHGPDALPIGVWAENASHVTLARVESYANEGVGILVTGTSSNVLVSNSDAHHNADPLTSPPGGNADGIQVAFLAGTTSGNRIINCRAWANSDDGFDLYGNQGATRVEGNWSFSNGTLEGNGDGFKTGSDGAAAHTFQRNLAVDNRYIGFDTNGTRAAQTLANNTAVGNGGYADYALAENVQHVARNNISLDGLSQDIRPTTDQDRNSWNMAPAAAADFLSLDKAQLLRPRKADGSLPDITAFRLAAGSHFVDAGSAVGGIAYRGIAPDLGAFER